MAKTLSQIDHELNEERTKLLGLIDEYNERFYEFKMLAFSCGMNIYDLRARAINYK